MLEVVLHGLDGRTEHLDRVVQVAGPAWAAAATVAAG